MFRMIRGAQYVAPDLGGPVVSTLSHGSSFSLDAARTVNWSVSPGPQGQPWSGATSAAFGQALNAYAGYADIHFRDLGLQASPVLAGAAGSDMNLAWAGPEMFGTSTEPSKSLLVVSSGYGYYDGDWGDIYLNTASQPFATEQGPGTPAYDVLLRAVGAVLGLKEPDLARMEQIGLFNVEPEFYTVMAHHEAGDAHAQQPWTATTPLILDVLVTQFILGRNMETNAGDSMLSLRTSHTVGTTWDAAGNDWASAEGDTHGWLIALPQTRLIPGLDTAAGFAAPRDQGVFDTLYWLAGDYENARGSAQADWIKGNALDNVIEGGAGNDTLDGGIGLDTAVFTGTRAQSVLHATEDALIVTGADGEDQLTGFERLVFEDMSLALDVADGNAGIVVKLLGMLLGPERAHDPALVGLGLSLMDKGMTPQHLATYGLQRVLGPNRSDEAVFDLVNSHLDHALSSMAWDYLDQMANGSLEQGVLVFELSHAPQNLDAIGWDALVRHGVDYIGLAADVGP